MPSYNGNRLKKSFAILMSWLALVSTSFAESLWDPDSPGLLAGSSVIQTGDTLLVSIDIDQDLSYDSSRIDSERVSIELTGGEGGDLFSFLPTGSSSGNQSLTGSEEISFQTAFAVSVVEIDADGNLLLRGGRTVDLQGKQATITLTGTADPSFVGEGLRIPFSSIVDARIVYETLLSAGEPVIQPEDIEEVPAASAAGQRAAGQGTPVAGAAGPAVTGQPAAGAEAAAAEEPAAEAAEPGVAESAAGEEAPAAAAGQPVATVPALTEEKKRELLLLYLNRLFDLVFE